MTYKVTFDANAGNNAPQPQYKTHGSSLTLSETIPARDGFIFKGWSTEADGTTPMYLPGDNYTKNEVITLYAVWEPVHFNVYYFNEDSDGYLLEPEQHEYGKTWQVSNQIPARDGFTFLGWHFYDYMTEWTESWDGHEANKDTSVSFVAGETVSPGKRTFSPGWEINDCTVSYVLTAVWKEKSIAIKSATTTSSGGLQIAL